MAIFSREYYRQQEFFPSFAGLFVNPFYFARRGLATAISDLAPKMRGSLLDVGCGSKPYEKLYKVDEYIGLDIESGHTKSLGVADYFYDGEIFPFSDGRFDSVVCSQVLEHVFEPDSFIKEISRVLKTGGQLLLTIPFVWDEHEQPYDYARYSSFGLKSMLVKNGFEVLEHRKSGADASILFQMANLYLYKAIAGLPRWIRRLLTVTVMAFLNLAGVLFSYVLPKNEDLYLDQIVLARKLA